MARRYARQKAKAEEVTAAELFRIPRHAFAWLLVSLAAVILPHAIRMPWWLTTLCALCMVGRILIWQGRISYPGRLTRLALVGLIAVLIPLQFGRDIFSTDATVAVLLAGVTLKLLEMHHKRDVLLVVYLLYFAAMAVFIYSQSIPMAVYMAATVLLITSTLMALHQSQEHQSPRRTLRLSGIILAQSVPLMLVIFVLFPRISPLWAVPLQSNQGTTGLSDNLSPGDIGELTRSAEIAFRVKFAGEPPPYAELYWRAITMDEFDGRAWRRGRPTSNPQSLRPGARDVQSWYQAIDYQGDPVDYNVIMEPNFQNWIYTLLIPQFLDERMMMQRDYTVSSRRQVTQRYTYDARSWLSHRVEAGEEGSVQIVARQLPRDSNPQARLLAQTMRAGETSDVAYINAVLNLFRNEEFYYTLAPVVLGDDPVDNFLFESREGYCEHYASSFTYLMRAAGIPARVVTGYQGGEYNPYDGTLTVRQYDAHAWSEVWLPDRGWFRVDPTSAVAPQRINEGSNAILQQTGNFGADNPFSLMRFRGSLLLNDLRYRLEMIDYTWNRFVLNYDQDMQFNLLTSLFGGINRTRIILAMLGLMALFALYVTVTVFRKPAEKPYPPALVQYLRLCRHLARQGYARRTGETPLHYMERVGNENPQWRDELKGITHTFIDIEFAGHDQNPDKLKHLRRSVRRFRMRN